MPFKSSHRRCSFIKDVKNFENFTGKHLCWSLFLIKLQLSRPATLWKGDFMKRCFPVKKNRIFKNTYFKEHLKKKNICQWLLLALHMRWNQLYISTMVLQKWSCFVICLKFSSLLFLASSLFSNSVIRTCFFEKCNYDTILYGTVSEILANVSEIVWQNPLEIFWHTYVLVYLQL